MGDEKSLVILSGDGDGKIIKSIFGADIVSQELTAMITSGDEAASKVEIGSGSQSLSPDREIAVKSL